MLRPTATLYSPPYVSLVLVSSRRLSSVSDQHWVRLGHHAVSASGTVATTTSPRRVHQPHASSPATRLAPTITAPSPAAPGRVLAENASGTDSVLPVTGDPSAYATAYAGALFSYDTRNQGEAAWAAVLASGLDPTPDVHADNLADLADRTPPAAVWATMTGSSQRATYIATSASVPTLWAENAAAYPVGAFAVTVTGTQQVTWNGGASTAPQSVTLLLLCPPFNELLRGQPNRLTGAAMNPPVFLGAAATALVGIPVGLAVPPRR